MAAITPLVNPCSALLWLAKGGTLQYAEHWVSTKLSELKEYVASEARAKDLVVSSDAPAVLPALGPTAPPRPLLPCEEIGGVDGLVLQAQGKRPIVSAHADGGNGGGSPHGASSRKLHLGPRGEFIHQWPGLTQVAAAQPREHAAAANLDIGADAAAAGSTAGPVGNPGSAAAAAPAAHAHADVPSAAGGIAGGDGGEIQEQQAATQNEPDEPVVQSADGIIAIIFVMLELVALYVAMSAGEGIPELTTQSEVDPQRYRLWVDRPLDCCEHPALCISALFCPCVVFGQTAERIGCKPLDQFWKGFLTFFVVLVTALFMGLLGMTLIGALVYAVRTKLKEAYEFRVQSDNAQDYMLACCCPTLAIAQEARHVESSRKAGFVFTPALRWPDRPRPNAAGMLAGPPVGVLAAGSSSRGGLQWQGVYRGACGFIDAGGPAPGGDGGGGFGGAAASKRGPASSG